MTGSAHRDDPTACTVDTLTLGDKPTLERYQQLSDAKSVDRTKRPFRLPNGKPNLAGEWAQEQHVLAAPPGGRVGLVPISQAEAVRAGKVPPRGPAGWFPPPVTLTAAGRAAQEALGKRSTSENPRLSCQITSILFDWVFDGAIDRITQSATPIKMEYGVGLTRTVHMNMTAHPAKIAPSRGGHSIGRWDGDTLVVDTVGFLPGSLAGNLPHSDKLHVVERFTLNPATLELTRGIVAEDPRLLRGQVRGFRQRPAGGRAVQGRGLQGARAGVSANRAEVRAGARYRCGRKLILIPNEASGSVFQRTRNGRFMFSRT